MPNSTASASAGTNGGADFTFSLIENAFDKNPPTETSLASFYEEITSLRWFAKIEHIRTTLEKEGEAAAKKLKALLPAALPSGTFSYRANENLTHHNAIIHVDLDKLGAQTEAWKEIISADSHTLLLFVSPSGNGLKLFFHCDANRPHEESFLAAEQYVLEHWGLKADPACKNVARLCFVSHDPDAYLNLNAEPLPYPPPPTEVAPAVNTVARHDFPANFVSPGDDYDARGDWRSLIRQAGWTSSGEHNWTRPGKKHGISATWDTLRDHPNRFYVFSSNAPPFAANSVYRPWHIFGLLHCSGNWKLASDALYDLGFGTRHKPKVAAPDADVQSQLDAQNEANSAPSHHISPEKPEIIRGLGYEWPAPRAADEFCANPPPTPPELIEGILYAGGTMLLSGPSKSHKTFSALDAGIAIASGARWLGHKTNKSVVLYLNLELQDFATAERISKISAARGHAPPNDLKVWNLRGHTITLAALTVQLPILIKQFGAKAVCVDPHYKVSAVSDMEENSNDSQGKLLTILEGLCAQAGAALIITHHFAKGDASAKNAIDRASGGGVFARWGDVMLTFTPHEQDDCMTVEMALRNFAPVKPFVVRWEYPRWQRDDALDASNLKRAKHGGFQEQVSPDDLLSSLGDNLFSASEWIAASGVSRATFYRKRQDLIDSGKVVCQMGTYKRKT